MINNTLDKTDFGILNALQKDSRTFYKDIAKNLHKSVTAIHTRIRRLGRRGLYQTVHSDHRS